MYFCPPLVATPAPQQTVPVVRADDAPAARLDHHEKARLRVAVHRAKQLYPGPIARLIERELMTWEEFGYRLDMHGEIAKLVHHISTAVVPTPTPTATATAPPGQRSA